MSAAWPRLLPLLLGWPAVAWAQAVEEGEEEEAEQEDPPEGEEEQAGEGEQTEEEAREADIFGAGSPAPAPAAAPAADLPGGAMRSDEAIASRLREADRRLTIGGLAYLRAAVAISEEAEPSLVQVSSPSILDLYADARPTDRLRMYARGRLSHDFTVQEGDVSAYGTELEPTRVALDQLWLNFDVGRRLYVTAGRQRIKWGVGRLWNPTDFLAPATYDALTVFDERMGVGLLKLHLPVESTGTNLYAIAELEGAQALDEIGGAARVEQILGPGEVALSAAMRKDEPVQLGAQASFPLWLFDLKAEAALQRGVNMPGWEGSLDLETLTLPTEVDRSEEWVLQVLAGTELGLRYNDEDQLYLGVEYLYNDLGVDDPDLYPWMLLQGWFTPFYLGRHYLAGYLSLPGPGQADEHRFTLTGITNLSDETVIGRFDYAATVLTELTVNAYAQVHGGPSGGEFAFALDIPPIPTVLDAGLSIPRPVVDLGLGAQVRF